MTVQLTCPWCQDEVAFEVDQDRDELTCTRCSTQTQFAPDSLVTFDLLYDAIAA